MIDLNEIENVLATIKSDTEKYEQEISNIYNEIETFSSWKGYVRDNFINLINADMLSAKILISEIKDINEIIDSIYDRYSEIGMKLEFNVDKFDAMNTKAERIVTNMEKVKEKYSSLDTSFCDGNIKSAINSSKKEVTATTKKLTGIKNKIRITTSKIKDNEKMIATNISKIEVKNINIVEAVEYVTPKVVGGDGDYTLNTNDMEGLIGNIQNSKTNIEEIISNLENSYNTVSDNYNTKNTESFVSLYAKVIDEMNKLEQLHENYITGLEKYVNDIIDVNSKDFMEGVELK